MPPEEVPPQEEDYASSEDSDFAPDDALGAESSPSDNEDTGETTSTLGGRKRRAGGDEAEDAGFENSGDEAVIEKWKKRRKKIKSRPSEGDAGDDDGGEGGLIKTRSMRAQEKAERKAAGPTGPVTIDADSLWAQLTGAAPAAPAASTKDAGRDGVSTAGPSETVHSISDTQPQPLSGTDQVKEPTDMIRIKRTYNFAGKVHTEEKLVARDSAEAKLYLAGGGEAADGQDGEQPARRMPRKAFRSAFEPINDQVLQQRADLNLGIGVRLRARELAMEAGAKKLNTVEKSRMDWAGYVDKEGIKDELELAGKSKGSYAARQEFLARSEAKREEDARRARLAGRA